MTEVERIKDPFLISFPKLGWEFHIDPTAFTVFGIEIQWYGILITIGLLLAIFYCFPRMKRFGIDADRAVDAVIGGIIGGIIGARAYYVILRWDEYAGDWKSIFNLRGGGLAIYGGIIGAVIVGIIVSKFRKVKILPMLDISVIGFLIGQGIGRWGNFVNQEAFGSNTDSLLGMTGGTIQQTIINESAFMDGYMYQSGLTISENYPVHPCFLYESLWCLLGFVLLAIYSKHRKYDGQMLLMYLSWYGAERFVVEGLRTDSLMIGSLRASQALSALIVAASLILQVIMYFKVKRDPERFVLYCNTEDSKKLLSEAEKHFKQKYDDEIDDEVFRAQWKAKNEKSHKKDIAAKDKNSPAADVENIDKEKNENGKDN